MQKRGNFARLARLFLPSFLFFALCGNMTAFFVGLLNPVAALKEGEESPTAFQNPFRDFNAKTLFEDKERRETSAELPNPNYTVKDEFFGSRESDIVIKKENCYVKNMTGIDNDTVKSYMLAPLSFKAEKNSPLPQILIMHTHATESYLPPYDRQYDPEYSFRSTDNEANMTAVGRVMAERLNRLGYNTLHDETLHDYPSYNGSYDNSKATVESYLEKYPSIKIVLDVHRDAVERDGAIISPSVTINGTKYAQIMIISGADNGYMNMPNYPENLKFASALQNSVETLYPGLARPILFDYRNYNQQLTTGSVLIEVGSHGATLSMAKNSRRAVAQSLAAALDGM